MGYCYLAYIWARCLSLMRTCDQRRLRRACVQSRLRSRCSYTQMREVVNGSDEHVDRYKLLGSRRYAFEFYICSHAKSHNTMRWFIVWVIITSHFAMT